LDGEAVLPILAGKQPVRDRTFFWRLPRPDGKHGQKAVRRGKWKYIWDREMELLFDLEKDVGERINLAFRYPGVVAELREALMLWEKELPATK
jgi:arylsulfatase A-like enzyme